MAGADSRKTRSIEYYLPSDVSGDVGRVCRVMFLTTVNVAERQVRTTLEKLTTTDNLQPHNRGGRPQVQQQRDERVHRLVKSHIDRFPHTESHYGRSDTTFEYLSSELTLTKIDEHTLEDAISFSFYICVFCKLNQKK